MGVSVVIAIDPRIGSKELLPYFKPFGVEVDLVPLEFGDVAWWGNGPTGLEFVGVERKVLTDLIQSMRSKRLSGHQLPGLLKTYDHIYLLIEGVWRCGKSGEIEEYYGRRGWCPVRVGGSRGVLYTEVEHYLATLEHLCGVRVVMTSDEERTVAWCVSRYRWWTEKEWEKHDSHVQIYAPYREGERNGGGRGSSRGTFRPRTIGLTELWAAQLEGVNKKAYEVGKRFKSPMEMANASEQEWVKLLGKKTGMKAARRIRGESW